MSTHGHETSGSAYDDRELAALPLAGARQDLLEAIMATPVPTRSPDHGSLDPRPTIRRRGWLAAGLAAAAVSAAVAVPTVLLQDGDDAPSTPGAPFASGGEAVEDPPGRTPRLLVPGWRYASIYGIGGDSGEADLVDGDRSLEVTWYPAGLRRSYLDDRAEVSRAERVTLLGEPGVMVRYSPDDLATISAPFDGHFVEVRGGVGDEQAYREVLSQLQLVDYDTWVAALPADAVLPADRLRTIDEMLADVPVPSGFDAADIPADDYGDRYHFGAAVTGAVTCRWIQQYEDASQAGDDAAATEAAEALRSSRDWAVLQEMDVEGDYPEVVWEVSRDVVRGDVPAEYAQGLGCD